MDRIKCRKCKTYRPPEAFAGVGKTFKTCAICRERTRRVPQIKECVHFPSSWANDANMNPMGG